jgi:glycosyltransferase involved in cell wall biosynthesis
MKIFFFESCDDGTVGGSHTCMYNLIRNLDRPRIEVTTGFYSDNVYTQRYRELGIEVEILPFPKPVRERNIILRKAINWYNRDVKAGRYLEYYFKRKGFDLVVLNNSIYASLLLARVSKRLGIPVVVYERGIGHYKKKHINATADIQASIPISDTVHQNLLACKFKTSIIERIYDGIEPESVRPRRSPSEVKASLDIPIDGRVLGIIGNVRPWKGQKYFVDAFIELSRQYQDLYGLVVGGWGLDDQTFQASLAETVQRERLRERVKFLGYRTDVPDLLSILDIIVHASTKTEPFGMVILEAMAARKPVVATESGGPVEILNRGECGLLVRPKDGTAIAEACRRYLQDPGFALEKVEQAYNRVRQHFHIRETVERTIDLFEGILSGFRTETGRGTG